MYKSSELYGRLGPVMSEKMKSNKCRDNYEVPCFSCHSDYFFVFASTKITQQIIMSPSCLHFRHLNFWVPEGWVNLNKGEVHATAQQAIGSSGWTSQSQLLLDFSPRQAGGIKASITISSKKTKHGTNSSPEKGSQNSTLNCELPRANWFS